MVQKIIAAFVFILALFLGAFFVFQKRNTIVPVNQRQYIVVKSFRFGYPFEISFEKGTTLQKIVQAFNLENKVTKNIYIKKNSSWTLVEKNIKLYEDFTFKVS